MTEPAQTENAVVAFVKQRWLTIVLVVLAVVFILQNRGETTIHVLWMTVNSPLWLFLALMFLAGIVAGAFYRRRKKK
ncbi:LapA family protein [Sanguibacter inulinus]|uniref:LapA family protein n=1 Tax=Sanguibacter inulinus TaxID=60922 RepID=A0A853EUD7_9MICO|nr:LapA family protein [Sanguibacter inulinus]MBF0723171.1 LapA family protein [Sanguibacter inulinus]NYS94316.1 LapA family protein [Sanguibacter inulinus]